MMFRPLSLVLPASLVAAAGLAWFAVPTQAQTAPPTAPQTQPTPPPAGPGGPRADRPMREFSPQKACIDRNARQIGKRAYLKARLDLKPEQMPLWANFEKASDDVSAKQKARCAALPTEMKGAPPAFTDRMTQREDRMKFRLESMQAVKPSLTALYASLTPEQKELFERTGRRGGGHHRHGGHRHR